MTSPRRPVNFLRIVELPREPTPFNAETLTRPAWQSTLFATEHPSLLAFIEFARISESDFLTFVTSGRPKFVFDLRRVPRFDIGNLNRRLVFSLFTQSSTRYVDLSGRLGAKSERDARLDPRPVVDHLLKSGRGNTAPFGPIGFLVDHPQFQESYISDLVEALPSAPGDGWDVLRIPAPEQTASLAAARNLVFISHANPEDNVFATWLGARLTLAGYSVWSDVSRLIGGEVFWNDIEEAIRYHSAKVLVVLSRTAQTKPGVLDEVDLAVRVERANGSNGFVIPIRVDDLPFSEVRANLARKNVLDFNANWASGLSALLKALERDGVPRTQIEGAAALGKWAAHRIGRRQDVLRHAEELFTNWLPCKLPAYVRLFDIDAPSDRIGNLVSSCRFPTFRYLRLIGSFVGIDDLQPDLPPEVKLTERYRFTTEEFSGGRSTLGVKPIDAQKMLSSLARQAWDLRMARTGCIAHQTASGATAWFIPAGLIEADQVVFNDLAGKRRRRNLVGWSERRQVFWHYAIEARPVLGRYPRYVLRHHVIFTTDGKNPVDSVARMHSLRRSFCRNWWNDRWRDLLIAFVAWLAEERSDPTYADIETTISIEPSLMRLVSPVTVAETLSAEVDENVHLESDLDPDDDDDGYEFPEPDTHEDQEMSQS